MNIERGEWVRRALLAIVRAAHQRGCLLPPYAKLGKAVGCNAQQVSRHMNRLMDEGALVLVHAGVPGKRLKVESVRS